MIEDGFVGTVWLWGGGWPCLGLGCVCHSEHPGHKFSPNETLGVKDSVVCIHGSLRLGSVNNKALGFVEGHWQ